MAKDCRAPRVMPSTTRGSKGSSSRASTSLAMRPGSWAERVRQRPSGTCSCRSRTTRTRDAEATVRIVLRPCRGCHAATRSGRTTSQRGGTKQFPCSSVRPKLQRHPASPRSPRKTSASAHGAPSFVTTWTFSASPPASIADSGLSRVHAAQALAYATRPTRRCEKLADEVRRALHGTYGARAGSASTRASALPRMGDRILAEGASRGACSDQ
jgi:hypothetical protein